MQKKINDGFGTSSGRQLTDWSVRRSAHGSGGQSRDSGRSEDMETTRLVLILAVLAVAPAALTFEMVPVIAEIILVIAAFMTLIFEYAE